MKNVYKIGVSLLVIAGMLLLPDCKKDDNDTLPTPEIVKGEDVTDIDGNVYHTVIIGTKQWTVENLKTTKFNDGSSIPTETDNETWITLTTPGYCWYNNQSGYKSTYGALYNWYAVNTGKLAPEGWHVPGVNEWKTLINYLGGEDVASAKLREKGTIHWKNLNEESTNEVGFTALPGGYRYAFGGTEMGENCYFWSTQSNTYLILNNSVSIWTPWVDANCIGLSVRCIKDYTK